MKRQIIFIITLFIGHLTFAQQDATINITGHASKLVAPDKAIFSIHIRANKKTESESYKAMTDISNELLNRLKKEGFTESQIKLTDYSIQMEYDYSSDKAQKKGYTSSQNLIVKFPLDKRRVLTVYSNLTANEMEGVSINFGTECSDSLKNKVQDELIVLALNDAKEKATLIATTTDTKIKSIADVSYKVVSNNYSPVYSAKNFSVRGIVSDEQQQASDYFSINEIEFSEDVKVTYWIQNLH